MQLFQSVTVRKYGTSGRGASRIPAVDGERQPLVATFCNVRGLDEPRELIILNVNACIVGAF